MKMILCFILLAFGASAAMADSYTYECYGESSDEKIRLNIDFSLGTTSLGLRDRGHHDCASSRFNENGDVRDYGRAVLTFDCRGSDVLFVRNYDEEILELGDLAGRLGLMDSTYMCH